MHMKRRPVGAFFAFRAYQTHAITQTSNSWFSFVKILPGIWQISTDSQYVILILAGPPEKSRFTF